MGLEIYVTLLSIAFTNIIIHSIGLYLLQCIHKSNGKDVQHIYIINLSAVEIFGNILWFLVDLLNLIKVFITPSSLMIKVHAYLAFVICTVFLLVYYLSMVFIAIDKFLEIWLNIKYPLYWNSTKAKYLITGTWILGCFFCFSIIIAYNFGGFKYQIPFVKYVYPTFDLLCIFIVVICFNYIFHIYKKTQTRSRYRTRGSTRRTSVFYVFLKSRFYTVFLLIFTFLIFVIIPDLIYLFIIIRNNGILKSPNGTLLILYHISFLSDAWIYIFLQPPVRRLLWKKLRCVNASCCNAPMRIQGFLIRCNVLVRKRIVLHSHDIELVNL